MSNERGHYGKPRLGVYGTPLISGDGSACPSSSWVTWLVGGIVIGGGVLWAKHQADQIEKLTKAAGLPQQSFVEDIAATTKELSGAAREKIQGFTKRLGTGKGA